MMMMEVVELEFVVFLYLIERDDVRVLLNFYNHLISLKVVI